MTGVVTTKRMRVQMTSLDDENENIDKANVQLEARRKEPLVDINNEEYDIELTKVGIKKELKAGGPAWLIHNAN